MDIQAEPVIVTRTPAGFHVAVKGPVHSNVAWLEQEFDRVVAAKPAHVDLDLAGTGYVSSLGVGLFVSFRRRLADAGGTLRVTAIRRKVFNTFRFAHLDALFQIAPAVVMEDAA